MRKTVATILLLCSLGLNWPAAVVLPTQPDHDRHPSNPLSPDTCQFQLAQIPGEPTGIKSTAGVLLLARLSPYSDWRPVERTGFPPRANNAHTLQSQHVLLRI